MSGAPGWPYSAALLRQAYYPPTCCRLAPAACVRKRSEARLRSALPSRCAGHCRFGETCRFDHPSKFAVKLNKDGLPIRPGEPPCSFYERFGECRCGRGWVGCWLVVVFGGLGAPPLLAAERAGGAGRAAPAGTACPGQKINAGALQVCIDRHGHSALPPSPATPAAVPRYKAACKYDHSRGPAPVRAPRGAAKA